MFYPTEQGAQHDADCTDGESFTYCGNCKWESSVENCMFEIDALINSMDTVELWNITSTKRVYTFDVEAELVKFREFWKGEPGKEVLNCYI
jgi:hypothetical protein